MVLQQARQIRGLHTKPSVQGTEQDEVPNQGAMRRDLHAVPTSGLRFSPDFSGPLVAVATVATGPNDDGHLFANGSAVKLRDLYDKNAINQDGSAPGS